MQRFNLLRVVVYKKVPYIYGPSGVWEQQMCRSAGASGQSDQQQSHVIRLFECIISKLSTSEISIV